MKRWWWAFQVKVVLIARLAREWLKAIFWD